MNDNFFQKLETDSKEKATKKESGTSTGNVGNYEKNSISSALKVFGWIIGMAGIIAGVGILADTEELTTGVISIWFISLLSMFLILGLAEIIQLLDDIKHKIK